jgi:hypothetical protein
METIMSDLSSPPEEITLFYNEVSKAHVFTASGKGMSGFHISHHDLRKAFDLAGESLGCHVALVYGVPAHYEFEHSFKDFEEHLRGRDIAGNIVKARIATAEIARIAH